MTYQTDAKLLGPIPEMEKAARRMARRNWSDDDSQAYDDAVTPAAVLALIEQRAKLLRALRLAHELCLSSAPKQAVGEVLATALAEAA